MIRMSALPLVQISGRSPLDGSLRDGAELGADQPDAVDIFIGVPAACRDSVGEHGARPNRRRGGTVQARQRVVRCGEWYRQAAGAVKRKLSSHAHTVATQSETVISNRRGDFR